MNRRNKRIESSHSSQEDVVGVNNISFSSLNNSSNSNNNNNNIKDSLSSSSSLSSDSSDEDYTPRLPEENNSNILNDNLSPSSVDDKLLLKPNVNDKIISKIIIGKNYKTDHHHNNYNNESMDDDYEPDESKDDDDDDYTIGRKFKESKKNRKRKSSTKSISDNKKKKKLPQSNRKETTKKKPKSKSQKSSSTSELFESTLFKNEQSNCSSSSGSGTSSNILRNLLNPNDYKLEQIFPPELLVRLFSLIIELEAPDDPLQALSKLAQVCEHWRRVIVSTSSLWTTINLSSLADCRFPMERFRKLHQENNLFQSVRHIDLSRWKGEMATNMLEFLTKCSQHDLHSLSIRRCTNISTAFLKTIITHAGNLRSLNISGITTSHQNCQNLFQTTTFKSLIERCGETLNALYMAENILPSFNVCFSLVLEYCPNLEVLDISNLTTINRDVSVSIEKFQQSCPKIRVLRAANVVFQVAPSGCGQSVGWPHLEELSIPFNISYVMNSGHNDQVIEQLTRDSENLTLLDVRGSPDITPRGLVKIPAWSLKHLSISNCPRMQDEILGMVFQKWKSSLVDVDISWNKSESCIRECIQAIIDLPKDEIKLKTLDLRGSAISLETLRRLILHCGDHSLQTIDLQSCRSLPRGMKRLFHGEEFQQLRQYMLEGRCD